MRGLRSERGAAAVELALVLPVLLVLVLGIVEFGRAFQVQATLAAAAREGARVFALGGTDAEVEAAVISASASLDEALIDPQPELRGDDCAVVVDYPMEFITDFFGATIGLSATGVMRCHG